LIPVTLKLTNFMSYGADVPPLDFSQLHTACISGANGHGKSTLIDAMTWALWGRTRAAGNDDLVRTGEREMSVEFTFDMADQRYRVLRLYRLPSGRSRSGKPVLEFQVRTGDGDWNVLSGATLTETQQIIRDVLHMDYDTFTNSALLLQGHADEFTSQRPADRKKVLATILGLDYYDRLEDRARSQARVQETQRAGLAGVIGSLDEELGSRDEQVRGLAEARAELKGLDVRVTEARATLEDLRRRKDLLDGQQAQLAQLRQGIQRGHQQIVNWKQEIEERGWRLAGFQALAARRDEIEKGYAQLTAARQTASELERRFRELSELETRQHKLEVKINQASAELNQRHALLGQQVAEQTQRQAKGETARRDLAALNSEQAHLDAEAQALTGREQARDKLAVQHGAFKESLPRLEAELKGIQEKAHLIHGGGQTNCPLCETALEPARVTVIQDKYAADIAEQQQQITDVQVDLAQAAASLKSMNAEIAAARGELDRQRRELAARQAGLQHQVNEAATATAELEKSQEELAQIEGQLARREFAEFEQQALVEIEAERTRLDYDPARYETAQQGVRDYQGFEADYRALEQADGTREEEAGALKRAQAALAELEAARIADAETEAKLAEATALLPALTADLTHAQENLAAREAEHAEAQRRVTAAESALKRLDEIKVRRGAKEQELKETARRLQVYRELAAAFGKRGVQALLIELALPEIENEANRLLSRMTDGRMHLKIETQRETKAGEVAETLDIKISDELGTRNYEMFSGGEAFRINFALRIALSRLLAHRAGAPLPTLIIDEGFGTQDSDGIEKLKEAINTIQPDFEKILVITHIDELKDAFPVRIDVLKTDAGSSWRFV
jgi:DNA repair protein SbcC/Rad50